MPHFFSSLRRSKDHDRHAYPRYDDYTRYDSHEPQPSDWRRVVPPSHRDGENWQEEMVEYPETYPGRGEYPGSRRSNRPATHDYPRHRSYDVQSESTATATDDVPGSSRYYTRDNAVPIVQRESSLTRLQEVFSDHAASVGPRPVTEVTLPQQGTPRANPVDIQQPPPPAPAAELRTVYAAQQQPVLVQNSTIDSSEADIRIQRPQTYGARDKPRAPSRSRSEMRREPSTGARSMDEEEFPPCVVVVERGRHGKPDTYYVIPGVHRSYLKMNKETSSLGSATSPGDIGHEGNVLSLLRMNMGEKSEGLALTIRPLWIIHTVPTRMMGTIVATETMDIRIGHGTTTTDPQVDRLLLARHTLIPENMTTMIMTLGTRAEVLAVIQPSLQDVTTLLVPDLTSPRVLYIWMIIGETGQRKSSELYPGYAFANDSIAEASQAAPLAGDRMATLTAGESHVEPRRTRCF
ncbi:hypothetical protein NM688_g92 [Phlebia brevispora]|uniref:Uncharacterized protein n=1 Tax=Phlebia brevispora TaxID=194682 RepID=A0ACC1TF37_9APHY|nr:hypothetical protein NM688_g92 [Phlebia brevispora]